MSQGEHTPGPWRWDGIGAIETAKGDPIVVDRGMTDANARLIASAPDLLAACKAAHTLISAVVIGSILGHKPISTAGTEVNRVTDLLSTAIDKAEGES